MLTRYPLSGAVKTRLAAETGSAEALAVHRQLATLTARELAALQLRGLARTDVWADGGYPAALRAWLGPVPRYRRQPEGDLGARLRAAAEAAFRAGAPAWVGVGSDCPDATAGRILGALRLLSDADVVFGPADDGGYWLVGLARRSADVALPALFSEMPWSRPSLLTRSVEAAERRGLAVELLATLDDIDDAASLDRWRERERSTRAGVAVVIPTLDESACIETAVRSAWAFGADEVVVVDSGSADGTPDVAAAAGACVIVSSVRGRSSQMNLGASATRGGDLVFAHADTQLPAGAAAAVSATLADVAVAGGAFDFDVDDPRPAARAVAAVGRTRARVSSMPYGDQGLFTTRRTFEALAGFPDLPTMEDWEFVRRLRVLGRLVVLRQKATSSWRTWARHGIIRPTAVNMAAIGAYRAGVDPARIARWRTSIHAR